MNTFIKPLSRYFNQINDLGDTIEKISSNSIKLREEYHFLSTVPGDLQKYYPKVSAFSVGNGFASYQIEKIPSPDASYLLIDNKSAHKEICAILNSVEIYLRSLPSIKGTPEAIKQSVVSHVFEKNLFRLRDILALPEFLQLNQICQSFGYKDLQDYCLFLNQSLERSFLNRLPEELFYSHGDLCFSNIIWWNQRLFLIDPRGYQGDIRNTYRVLHYDMAKLSQSLLGRYDLINHELFVIHENRLHFYPGSDSSVYKQEFIRMMAKFNMDYGSIRRLEASLFLSLIPYHRESQKKMKGFLINSLQIFQENK